MSLATRADVTSRLGDEPDGRELDMIDAYLESASDAARYYGREWPDTEAPNAVRRMVADAVARFMRNPERFAQNRAADEALAWQDSEDVDWFTPREIERLGRLAVPVRLPSFGSIEMVAGTSGHRQDGTLYARVAGGGKPFPYLADRSVLPNA